MAYYGNYLNLRLYSVNSSSYVTRTMSRPATYDAGQPLTFPSKTLWYSGAGQLYPVSYAHDWSVTAGGVTVAYSQISRLCPLTSIVEFNGSVPAGTLVVRQREYASITGSVMGGITALTRTHSRNLLDATPFGSTYRRRQGSLRDTRWVLSCLFENTGEVERLHLVQASGEVQCLYMFTAGRHILGQQPDPAGPSYGGQYASYGRVSSVEVTGNIDGLLEAVVGFDCTPQKDAVLGTYIFTESEQDNNFFKMYPNNETVL